MWNYTMHVWICYLVGFLGAGSLFSATLCTLPQSAPPAASKTADPAPEEASLPPPRVDVPAQPPSTTEGQMGKVVEEQAPTPHELPQQAGGTGVPPVPLSREEPAPMPRAQTPPPPRFWMPGAPREPSLPDVESLHREIENLRLERAAMLAEETDLTTTKDLRAAKSTQADLQKRIVELIAKVAQQARKEKEAAPASSPDTAPNTAASGRRRPVDGDALHQSADAGRAPTMPQQHALHPAPRSASANLPDVIKQSLETKSEAVTDAPVDPLALAQSLFRARDYTAALNAYRKLDKEDQKLEDRVAAQYMMACCLRKLGKVDEASILYREVANASGNEFVVENAQWYLRTMKERRELEAQLDELRQRRQAMMPRKP
jgi:hypothetical protein